MEDAIGADQNFIAAIRRITRSQIKTLVRIGQKYKEKLQLLN